MDALRRGRPALGVTAAGCLWALFVGDYSLTNSRLAVVIAALPFVLVLTLTRLPVIALLAVASIPFTADVARGAVPSVQVAPSDLGLAITGAGLLVAVALGQGMLRPPSVLRPLAVPFGVYTAIMVVLLLAHPSLSSGIKSLQRLELTVCPAAMGALLFDDKRLRLGLRLYVICATALGLAFAESLFFGGTTLFSVQKNPAGQFVASAIIVALALPGFSSRFRVVFLGPLTLGLVATQSRGAVVALGASLVVLLLLRGKGSRAQTAALISVAAVGIVVAFQFLPSEDQGRALRTSSSNDYALKIRQDYRHDGINLYKAHPVSGIGVGNYLSGDVQAGTQASDPHNVLLLQAVEGGPLLVGGFLVLSLGPVVTLVRRRKLHPVVTIALAVQVGILTHGQVDVYWVRSTPVLGWFLIGAAVAFTDRPAEATGPGILRARMGLSPDVSKR